MAVGGGGYGSWSGGGSGYIQYFTKTLPSSTTLIKLVVGDEREASNVTINGNTITALPGGNGVESDGGDGYSGGGGGSIEPCDGGTNGEDGECDGGGYGTGEDISTYHFDNFKLSPGAGGCHYSGPGYYWGGGGGGVLINNEGPGVGVGVNKAGVQWSDGEGYGGGGTYPSTADYYGEPGVVILEIVGV